MSNILVGCDPEIFFQHKDTGIPMSIIGKLGGTKDKALQITNKGHGVLEDNCAAEFNIPPASTPKAFQESIDLCVNYLKQRAITFNAVLSPLASVEMPLEDLQDPAAWVFGCEPDYNAYTGKENPSPSCNNPQLRSAGGHVHVGFKNNPTQEESCNLIRWMDLLMGVPSVIKDKDIKRRSLYGKAGACRFKSYGVEYRTLSNFWILSKKDTKWVYDTTQKAVEYASKTHLPSDDLICDYVQNAINNSDVDLAHKTMEVARVCLGIR
jgi:hypothetical protein